MKRICFPFLFTAALVSCGQQAPDATESHSTLKVVAAQDVWMEDRVIQPNIVPSCTIDTKTLSSTESRGNKVLIDTVDNSASKTTVKLSRTAE